MSRPFLIRHPESRVTYELADVAFFVSEYQPLGFEIVNPAPMNYTVPEIPKAEKVKHGAPVKRTTDADADTGNGES